MFLSVTRLIRRWYIPRWYFTSPEPWWRGEESHPQEHERLLGRARRQRSADPKAGRGGHFLEVLSQHSRHSLQELNWPPGKPVPGAKPPPTSDMHPVHLNTAEGAGDEASVVGSAKTLNNR